jgi:hypothetical protein
MRQQAVFSALATLAISGLGCTVAAAQDAVPKPPPQICVNEVCTAEAAAPATGTIKWHPGHYMQLRSRHRNPAVELPHIEAIGNEDVIEGVLVAWLWRAVEKSKGVYDFSSIDAYLAKLKSLPKPKRLIIRIEERGFSSPTVTSVPDYLKTDPIYNGGEVPMGNGVVARIWEPAVMDRLIALDAALAARYDADPYVEGISTSETAIGFNSTYPAPVSYTPTALLTQFKRHVTAARAKWKRSQVFLSTNYLGTDAQMEDLIKHAMNNHTNVGGPDVFSREWVLSRKRALQSDEIVRGERGSGTNYRGLMAIKSEIQATELGGYIATFTPAQLYDVAYNIMHANYILWDRNDYTGGYEQQWDTGILPYIRKVGGKVYTQCPTSFQGRCDTK